jgi:hypothetical protein
MFKYFFVALLLLILASCGRPESLSVESGGEARLGTEEVVEGTLEQEKQLQGFVSSTELSKDGISSVEDHTETPDNQHGPQSALATEKSSRPIDISAAFEMGVSSVEKYDFSRKSTLPNLFDTQQKAENVSFSGKLINDPENPDYLQSLEGVEFSIEIKTR